MPRLFPFTVQQVSRILLTEYVDYGVTLIGADKLWDKYTGKGINVGIIDTGICQSHVDLSPNIRDCVSFINGEDEEDYNGHGSHVAGIIAGSKNEKGIIGVAPEVNLYSAKAIGKDGTGTEESVYNALAYLKDHKVNIINMSIGIGQVPISMQKLMKEMHEEGIIFVVAAGNYGEWSSNTLSGFAKLDFTISVGAIDKQKNRAPFSSIGYQLDYMEPGVDVYSCYKDGGYAVLSGTSMACPHMTGIVALLMEKNLRENNKIPTFKELMTQLNNLAQDLVDDGFDIYSGNGFVNLEPLRDVQPIKYYRVQIGAFKNKENAIRLRDEVRSKGLNAIIKYQEPYYKVQLNAFLVKENAEKFAALVRELGYNTYINYC